MQDKLLAVVTGASSGIGAEFANQLAERGYNLIITARRQERLAALAENIKSKYGVTVETRSVDLSEQPAIEEFADYLAGLDRVDMLVNSAGFGTNGAYAKIDPKRIAQEVNVDLLALMLLTRAVLPGMQARSTGDIINISSCGGLNPTPNFAPYSAVKAGVVAFSQSLYGELKGKGVRVQALCPGPVPTEFTEVAGVGDDSPAPAFMEQPPEDLVAGSLKDLAKNKAVSIPQRYCRWIFKTLHHLPLSWRLSMASGMAEDEATKA